MLAGRTPFGGGTIAAILARRLVNDPPSIREVNPAVPPQVDRVVLKALARAPVERFPALVRLGPRRPRLPVGDLFEAGSTPLPASFLGSGSGAS